MRATWWVVGALLLGGGVAWWQLTGGGAGEAGSGPSSPPLLQAQTPVQQAQAQARAPDPDDVLAADLVAQIGAARDAADAARAAALEARLKAEAWDAPSARRFAAQQGAELVAQARKASGPERVRLLDRARRLLSRAVLSPELFGPQGEPVPARAALLETIRGLNAEVLTYAAGLEGVTKPYVVPPGAVPVQIVTEARLPYGHNALLYWNKRGDLNPKRLRAGETLLLPLEELVVHVELDRRLLVLFLGEAFVKEFRVGVGKEGTPTPRGWFTVRKKQENPDWTRPQDGRRIPAGDPANELGSVWIHIANEEHPEHYGIHGTNRPDTVGSACSQGCVRLVDADAAEVYWWVRQSSAGGPPTRVLLH